MCVSMYVFVVLGYRSLENILSCWRSRETQIALQDCKMSFGRRQMENKGHVV